MIFVIYQACCIEQLPKALQTEFFENKTTFQLSFNDDIDSNDKSEATYFASSITPASTRPKKTFCWITKALDKPDDQMSSDQ